MSNIPEKAKTDIIGDALHAVTAPATPIKKPVGQPKGFLREPPAPKPQAQVIAAPRPKRRLNIPRLQQAGYLHNTFDATVEHGTTVEDIKDPYFWSNVATNFKPLDHITVTSEDASWGAYVRVIACDKTWAKVYVESFHDYTSGFADMPAMLMDEYLVRWTTLGKYAIIKKGTDGAPPLKENFSTAMEAYQWLTEYLRDMQNQK